jgi:hypothetical protein
MRSWSQVCTAVVLALTVLRVYGNEVKIVCLQTQHFLLVPLETDSPSLHDRTKRKQIDSNARACSVARAGEVLWTPSS